MYELINVRQNGGANRLPCVGSTLVLIIALLPKFVNDFAGDAAKAANINSNSCSEKCDKGAKGCCCMQKMVYACLCLLLMIGLLSGCADNQSDKQGTNGEENRLAEIVRLTESVTADLQSGDVVDIEATPELKLCFWEAANMDLWYHLPEFAEGEAPAYMSEYWYLVLTDNVVGLDENGYYIYDEERWETVPEGSEFGSCGCPMIPAEDAAAFVQRHFGDMELVIADRAHKMYDYDGEYYFAQLDGDFPQAFFDLQTLAAEKCADGRMIYTAVLNEYANLGYSEKAEAAIGEYMAERNEELTWYQAVTDMVLTGETSKFEADEKLTVKFYIDEETGDTVYLAVDWA